MIVKNKSSQNISINKSVQIDVNTPDEDDGLVLVGQTLDLSISLRPNDLAENEDLEISFKNGDLVLVVDGEELRQDQTLAVYYGGASVWATVFNPDLQKRSLYEGIAKGFLYPETVSVG